MFQFDALTNSCGIGDLVFAMKEAEQVDLIERMQDRTLDLEEEGGRVRGSPIMCSKHEGLHYF